MWEVTRPYSFQTLELSIEYKLLIYEGSSKSFRTFIFSRETVRTGGVVIGRVWECHVTSQSGKPADLAV